MIPAFRRLFANLFAEVQHERSRQAFQRALGRLFCWYWSYYLQLQEAKQKGRMMLAKLLFRKKLFSTDRKPVPGQLSVEVYLDIVRVLRSERDRYRRLATYLAEMASLYPSVYKGKSVDYILSDLENLFESGESALQDERIN